jgi:D-aminoacyl-tRNA deacylase
VRAVLQRVTRARVCVDGTEVGSIGPGLLVLLAAGRGDGPGQVKWMAEKTAGLRIFPDGEGKMNLSLRDINGEMLVVSQFTLYGDCRKGKRPSFAGSERPEEANRLYESYIREVEKLGITVRHGVFGAMMEVELINDGPVTLIVDSPEKTEA